MSILRTEPRYQAGSYTTKTRAQAWLVRHQRFTFVFLSAVWVLLLYWRALDGPFIYDDLDQIVRNPELASLRQTFARFVLAPALFTNQFRGVGDSNYRPLFWLSLMLDRRLWGTVATTGYHFVNLALHWLNGCLLFLLLRRTQRSVLVAGSTALVWLGLPINSEVVAWISAREYLLCASFLLFSAHAAYTFLLKANPWSLVATFVSCLAALFSHEAGFLCVPLALILCAITPKAAKHAKYALIATSLGSVAVLGTARYVVHAHGGNQTGAVSPVGIAFWKYVLWMVLPIQMSIERATSMPHSGFSSVSLLALCGVAGLCAATLSLRKKSPCLAGGVSWLILATLPFCGIVFIYQGMAERFMYFASAGLALAVSSVLHLKKPILRQSAVGILSAWMVWGVWRLEDRLTDWSDPVLLYQSSLNATPDPVLFFDLGWAWRERGDYEKALGFYEEAVRRKPEYEKAQASVGETLTLLKRPSEALPAYRQALALNPSDSSTRVDMAVAFGQLGDALEAEQEFREALKTDPDSLSALNDLGGLLVQQGRADEALRVFQRAIERHPEDPTAYFNVAAIYQQRGQLSQAATFYRKVLQITPDDPEAITNLARISGH